ncbi:MAG TPA: hypothetical protein VNC79_14055, partial [Mycobacteriales bacterium]|nr:hypothetical protein [Mycobacteriales bacterium]
RRVVVALLAGAAVGSLAGCADSRAGGLSSPTSAQTTPGSPPGSAAPAGTVLRLGLDDDGKTVTMAVGDRMIVLLSGGRLAGSWAVASYPRGVLATDLRSVPLGAVGFVARAAGSGPVELVRPLCGPATDGPCSIGGGVGPQSTAAVRWSVTVVVR